MLVRKVKRFVAYFYFVDWDCIGLGVSVCTSLPNIEIHLPFGFARIGWENFLVGKDGQMLLALNHDEIAQRTFGLDGYDR